VTEIVPYTTSALSHSDTTLMRLPSHIVCTILLLALGSATPSKGVSAAPTSGLLEGPGSLPWGHLPAVASPVCQAPSGPVGTPIPTVPSKENFVSFEEWKKIRENDVQPADDASLNVSEVQNTSASDLNITAIVEEVKSSGNRYNYASPDCSARIHSASSQTQHASSLLHKSRDRYMLTPCKAKQHWVVIELCDEIRVEAIEIAVWEFFSGIVREVKLSVEQDDTQVWKEVESFVGKNVRGVQVSVC